MGSASGIRIIAGLLIDVATAVSKFPKRAGEPRDRFAAMSVQAGFGHRCAYSCRPRELSRGGSLRPTSSRSLVGA
jgi:hypothetical protein